MRLVAALVLSCALLPAQTEREQAALEENFKRLDRNGDGQLERAEFPGSDAQYAEMDDNRNKRVTLEEYSGSAVAQRLLAAAYRNSQEPRPRVTATELQARRLVWIARFDRDRDGAITREEWTGSPLAFASMDADRNEVIDKRDERAAAGNRIVADARPGEPEFPVFTSRLPNAEILLRRLDRDKDQQLSRREVNDPLESVFEIADRDRSQSLNMAELRRIVSLVATAVAERNRGYAQPRAYVVPFSTWDKNRDGRLEQDEWLQRPALFPRIDSNRDAAVTPDEVERYRRAIEGVTFLERFDLDDNGRVTLQEFGGSPESFRRADRNGDGVVSRRDR